MTRYRIGLAGLVGAIMVVGAACAPTPPVPAPATPAPRVIVDGPAVSSDMVTHTLESDLPGARVYLAWPEIKEQSTLSAAMQEWTQAELASFLAQYPITPENPPQLLGTWSYVTHSKRFIGIRLTLTSSAAGASRTWSKTFYGDMGGTKVLHGSDFFRADHRKLIQELIVAGIRAQGKAPNMAALHDQSAALRMIDDVTVDAAGNATITVPQGVFLAAEDGRVQVTLPAAVVRESYTDDVADVVAAVAAQLPPPTIPNVGTVPRGPGSPEMPGIDCAKVSCIALTFEGGPGPQTAEIAKALKSQGIVGTFFVVGHSATENPGVIKQLAEAHLSVQAMNIDHVPMSQLPGDQQNATVLTTAEELAKAGAPRPVAFRPPFGIVTEQMQTGGLPVVLWSIDSMDLTPSPEGDLTKRVTTAAKPGAIVRFHDSGARTAAELPDIIAALKDKGYVFVTASEMCQGAANCTARPS